MKWKVFLVVALVCAGAGADLLACGNKFLVPSRGTRFGKVPIDRQDAKILVYAPPNSSLSKALGDIQVATLLAEVGYRPTMVSDPAELDSVLGEGGWQLVLADPTSLPAGLRGEEAPAILPVLHEPSRTQLAEAKQTYGQVIKSPAKTQRFVESIDYAVAARAGQETAASDRAAAP